MTIKSRAKFISNIIGLGKNPFIEILYFCGARFTLLMNALETPIAMNRRIMYVRYNNRFLVL